MVEAQCQQPLAVVGAGNHGKDDYNSDVAADEEVAAITLRQDPVQEKPILSPKPARNFAAILADVILSDPSHDDQEDPMDLMGKIDVALLRPRVGNPGESLTKRKK